MRLWSVIKDDNMIVSYGLTMREAQEYPLKIPRLSQKINSHAWLGLCTDEKNAMLLLLFWMSHL
jgi:hypothetical protein